MKMAASFQTIRKIVKEQTKPFLWENKKIIGQFIFTIFFIAIGIWFIEHERAELGEVKTALATARWQWVLIGLAITAFYLFLQGQMYVFAFGSVRQKIPLFDAVVLFIKRNFISVFLPAGGVSSLAFYTGPIEDQGVKKSQIHFASSIYGFSGILSVVIVAIPAFLYSLFEGTVGSGEWFALGAILILVVASVYLFRSILAQGLIYKLLIKVIPVSEVFLNDLQNSKMDRTKFLFTVLASVAIELTGIVHLYIAMIALGFTPSIMAATMGYIISVIFLLISPFLRGLGAIEVSMTFILVRFGFGHVEAIAITFLYRFFEFWTPFVAGIFAFLSKANKLLMRILPALFLFALGIVNIVSAITPAINDRIVLLKDFIPVEIIDASNFLVFVAGLLLLVTAAFMLKGLRNAWWFALVFSFISLVGHLTKAIDYEEAIIAFLVITILVATRKEYHLKSNPKLRDVGVQTSMLLTAAVFAYGIIGFYFLDKKQFNIDFSLMQSIRFTFQNFFLLNSSALTPSTLFGKYFLYSINFSGFAAIAFLVYTLIRSHTPKTKTDENEISLATELLNSFGRSALDYFKLYQDKLFFFSESKKAFLAYRIAGGFAVVLENPVAENHEEISQCIVEFDKYCYQNGMKSIFYRVPDTDLPAYQQLRKKALFTGQEGVVDLSTFNLTGPGKKSLRNAIHKMTEKGFHSTVHFPPVKDGVLQKIKSVSDEWLHESGRSEIIFSQGMFDWAELKQQTIITVENKEEKIIAFLNIIPDYIKGEATYDLIRKTKDAPNGVMDFILAELINYLKNNGYTSLNIGFAPMSGLDDPNTFPERSMKFAYEKIKSFAHFKGLREYKEKFEPEWHNRYLIYQHDYDLLQIPSVLSKVIKP